MTDYTRIVHQRTHFGTATHIYQPLILKAVTWCILYIMEHMCAECQKVILTLTKNQKDRFRKNLPIYCAKNCSDKAKARISSILMAATNRKYASERMKRNNPMYRSEIREKVRLTLIAIGHRPVTRGGNGHIAPMELRLLTALDGWVGSYSVATKKGRGSGYPTCYKIDIANPSLMIAIEVDGASHGTLARKEQDKKKQMFLEERGWIVLRFTNKQVAENLEGCVQVVQSTILKSKEITTTL